MEQRNHLLKWHQKKLPNVLIAMHKATFIESAIYLTIIRRARMVSESIAPLAEGRMGY